MRIPKISTLRWMTIVAILVIVIIILVYIVCCSHSNNIDISTDKSIDITPEQIASIIDIGEWEFLSVNDEEMVDTIRKGFFSDDELVRIYYGTIRLGVNMHNVQPHWIKKADSVIYVSLPEITLLDNDFIDEARTTSFFESGRWSETDKQKMYDRAYMLMKTRCLTKANVQSARNNAYKQFTNLFKSMGYNNIKINFDDK